MKKVFIIVFIMTGMVIFAQQFVIKNEPPRSVQAIKPKELFSNLIDLERRVPSLLRKLAELLEVLHDHIEACIDGDKHACTKKKDIQTKELYKERIIELNNTMTKLELSITRLVEILKINKTVADTKGC